MSMSNSTAAFDDFAWTTDKSLTWEDMEKLLHRLKAATHGEEGAADDEDDMAEGLAALIDDVIGERSFPSSRII